MLSAPFVSLVLCFPFVQGEAPLPTMAQGAQLMQVQDWVGAEKVFRARVDANSQDANSWARLGIALHNQSKWEKALAAHSQAAKFPGTAKLGAYNAGCASSRLGRVNDGIAWIQKATKAGWGNRALLATDQDLGALRKDERFAGLLPPLLEGQDLFVEKTELLHTLVGEGSGDQFGWVARVVGDLDGDGALDFAATAPTHKSGAGAVYVYSGRTAKLLFRLDGKPGWSLGSSVEGRVDIDGDGVMDVIAGAPGFGKNPGQVVVASGKNGSLLHTLTAGRSGDGFGSKVSGIQDLDGDGHDDILVGAPTDGSGKVYLYSGKNGHLMTTLHGESANDQFGISLDATRAEERGLLVIGAMQAGKQNKGRGYLYRYDHQQFEQVAFIDTDAKGSNLGQFFASFLGDIDHDGVPDAYISDWNHGCKGPSTGRAYVHSGKTGKRLLSIDGRRVGEGFGTSQAVCGDADGDGIADLCIGAWQNSDGAKGAGKIYLVSGKDGSNLATWTSKQAGDTLGFDAVGIGDVNEDGNQDFLVTAAWSNVQFGRQGRVFVIAGPPLAHTGVR